MTAAEDTPVTSTRPSSGPTPFPWRLGLALLAVSLGIRLLAWWAVTAVDAPVRYDEVSYRDRAMAASIDWTDRDAM